MRASRKHPAQSLSTSLSWRCHLWHQQQSPAQYCTEQLVNTVPQGTSPQQLGRAEQYSAMATAVAALSLNLEQDVALTGLWALIWLNYIHVQSAFSDEVWSCWHSTGAEARYAGRLGSAALDYVAHERDIKAGLVIYISKAI